MEAYWWVIACWFEVDLLLKNNWEFTPSCDTQNIILHEVKINPD